MATKDYNFQYVPLTGRLPGNSFVKQTEQAINELAGIVNEGSAQAEVITNLANTANNNSEEALEKANEALETSGRVYITLPNLDDADSYFDSQLYYFANSYSHNLPVQATGFLEVKTNDTKTACEQVFIADLTGLCYFRHGTITSAEVGSETVYSVTWDIWSSTLASEDYVQQEVNNEANRVDENFLPLSGGTLTGAINTANATWNKLGDDASFGDRNIAGKMCVKSQTVRNTGIAFFNQSDTNVGEVDVNNAFDFNKPVKEKGGFLVPIGIVQAFAGTTIPSGWLLCDGSAVSRTDYAELYAVIGDTYGAGDGTSTFNLPNLTDKFIQGNATSGTEHSAGLPNITGEMYNLAGSMTVTDQSTGAFKDTNPPGAILAGGSSGYYGYGRTTTLDASRSSSIYGNSTTVQPPALTMRYIIKY